MLTKGTRNISMLPVDNPTLTLDSLRRVSKKKEKTLHYKCPLYFYLLKSKRKWPGGDCQHWGCLPLALGGES